MDEYGFKDLISWGDPNIDKPGWIEWKKLLIAEQQRRASDKKGGAK